MWLLLGLFVIVLIYLYGTRTFGYWAKRGVKHDHPIPFFGTAKRQFLQQISYADIYDEMYWKYPKERFVGYYLMTTPLLVLRDPALIKHVLVTDFFHFTARSVHPIDDKPEPMLNNLFSCEGDLWRLLRQKLTPTYSSGKLKAMFPLIVSRAEKLQQLAADAASTGNEIDVRELMARYTMDFIGACGFGIDTDTLNDENSLFRKLGQRIFTKTSRDIIVYLLKYTMPRLFSHLHFASPFVEKNIIALVKSILQQRNYKPSGRNDLLDLLLELREKGKIVGESMTRTNPDGSPCVTELSFTDEMIAAQVFVFFGAGYEASAASSAYTLHELAHHPGYQQKCQEEVDAVLARHGNKLSYEAIKEMKFLGMCFRSSSFSTVNECRKQLFTKKDRQLEHIPTTNAALHQYFLRAVLKAVHIWGQMLLIHNILSPVHLIGDGRKESMRKFPSVAYLMRKCVETYTFPGTDITIDPGVKIIVPVKSLHADPQYFEDPEEFRPERFHPYNIGKIDKRLYLPFGAGPRSCIAERLGLMQSLAGLAAILSRFSVAPSESTRYKPAIDPRVIIVQSIAGGLPLSLVARQK